MELTNKQIMGLYRFLITLEQDTDETGKLIRVDKNKITDRGVRTSVIDNIVALAPAYEEIQKQESVLRSQYFTDNYLELYKQFVAANDINDTSKVEELKAALREAEKPFAEDYLTSREKLLNETRNINIIMINRDVFDKATESCRFSMRVYIEFAFMFIK